MSHIWSPMEEHCAWNMYRRGKSPEQIAKQLKRTPYAIERRLAKLGIKQESDLLARVATLEERVNKPLLQRLASWVF